MRIIVLSKRQYTGKDLLDDRYGRLYEIPKHLAERGHIIQVLLFSYRWKNEGTFTLPNKQEISYSSINLGVTLIFGLVRYLNNLSKLLDDFQPDLVWASSDVLHAIFAWKLCQPRNIPFIIDLYDNYESFGLTKIPGMTSLFRAACKNATGLTVVSHELDKFISNKYQNNRPRKIISNAIPQGLFYPRGKHEARVALGLPLSGKLIGTAGAITKKRGINIMFEAFLKLAENDPNIWLVFAGPRDETPSRYQHQRIIDMGEIATLQVPYLFCALDVAVICNLDTDFGRYCFPQKFYEIIACGTPIVAANIGEMARLLALFPDILFSCNCVESLTNCIKKQLNDPVNLDDFRIPKWNDQADSLAAFFKSIIKQY